MRRAELCCAASDALPTCRCPLRFRGFAHEHRVGGSNMRFLSLPTPTPASAIGSPLLVVKQSVFQKAYETEGSKTTNPLGGRDMEFRETVV